MSNYFVVTVTVVVVVVVRDYVRSELESGHEGPVYLEPLSMNRFTTALIGTVNLALTSHS